MLFSLEFILLLGFWAILLTIVTNSNWNDSKVEISESQKAAVPVQYQELEKTQNFFCDRETKKETNFNGVVQSKQLVSQVSDQANYNERPKVNSLVLIENELKELQLKCSQLEKINEDLQNELTKMYNKSEYSLKWDQEQLNQLSSLLPSLIQAKSSSGNGPSSFFGYELIDILVEYFNLENRKDAISLGQSLLDNNIIIPKGFFTTKFQDNSLSYAWKGPYKISPALTYATNYQPFMSRLDFEILEGFCLVNNLKKPLGDLKFSIELKIEQQIFKTKRCEFKNNLVCWKESGFFFIFYSLPSLQINLWQHSFVQRKKKIASTQFSVWELPKGQAVEKRIFFDKIGDESGVLFRFKYSFLRDTEDIGTSLPLESRLPSYLLKDPYYFYKKPSLHYNRCGISDIFCVLPEDATETQAMIYGTFEFFIPISDGTLIDLYILKDRRNGNWICYDTQQTKKGKVGFKVPLEIQKKVGRYNIRMVVQNDPSQMACGSLFIAEKNTPMVCFDIDGTLTVGNEELLKQLALDLANINYNTKLRRQAVELTKWWWAKGYILVYLSGRQGSAYNLTRNWLDVTGFPPGLIGHTQNHFPTIPIYAFPTKPLAIYGVGDFKEEYLQNLLNAGFILDAGYGNTFTDIQVYEKLGVDKSKTFTTGGSKGKRKTVPIHFNFTKHLEYLDKHIPLASPAFPVDSPDW